MKLMVITLFALMFTFNATASILIAPTQVYFDERDRTQEVTIINTSNEQKTYRMSLVDMPQGIDGRYTKLAEDENYPYSLKEVIRFSPRQVTLNPGERQSIKLLARNRSQLDNGDYRSHLRFTVLPNESRASNSSIGGAGINLSLMVNYTIPVLLRKGQNQEPNVRISNSSIIQEQGRYALQVNLEKQGDYSVLGSLEVFSKNVDGIKTETVGLLNGANFFRETNQIKFIVPLKISTNQFSNGLAVEYTDTINRRLVAESTTIN